MTRKEIIVMLHSLEEKYPINQWRVDDLYLWPIIKIDIFYKHFHQQNVKDAEITQVDRKKGFVQQLIETFRSFFYLLTLLLKRPEAGIPVIFSGANNYRVDFEGEFVNRYFQPMMEYMGETFKEDSLIIEYEREDRTKNYKSRNKLLFLKRYSYAAWLLQILQRKKRVMRLNGLEGFIKEVNERAGMNINYNSYISELHGKLKLLFAYTYIYETIFDKYKPQYVIGLCYYSWPVFAMNYAAYRKGVISVDMQHGGQGLLHISYSGFNNVPAEGYQVVPGYFWCWDEASAGIIRKWTDKQTAHKVLVGGNPWLSYFLAQSKKTYDFPDKKIILYTMQFNELEDFIIKAMQETPDDYQWWLRLHPRKLDAQPHIEKKLEKAGLLHKVEINNAINYPLPQILKKSVVHISRFSGSIIEASQLGIKTIIIDEVGVDSYGEYISSNEAICYLEADGSKLIALIMGVQKEPHSGENGSMFKYRQVINGLLKTN
ncbi:hypothetical protein [Chitinophaga sp. YR573]|uniref:hypothetical protein n=1 Tax=Chitinophaga sp. YR573 TaxID=1881040 RepID=UPI000B7D6F96|nr:hypothetical protein [Chitinophaga sp. YR573]